MSSSKPAGTRKTIRCAIYTRVSTDQGLDQEFNSLDAQREASEAYIKSQAHEGWSCLKDQYDDGGFSGGSMERPALQRLLEDVRQKKLDVIVVYKVDRLTRSLADFAKLVELFDAHEVSFVSVTQSFNTTSSMGRLTLNVLLSFAQFEREVTGERIRDKIAASKKKGLWMGGVVPHGYRVENRKLMVEPAEASDIRLIFDLYGQLKSIPALVRELDQRGIKSRVRKRSSGEEVGGITFMAGPLSHILGNRVYLGEINHRDKSYPGEHEPIISREQFDQVQQIKRSQTNDRGGSYNASGSLLAGLIYDDRGILMSPTHVKKGSVRYHYYQSSVLAHGLKARAGTVDRVPAAEIEAVVTNAVRKHCNTKSAATSGEAVVIRDFIERVEVYPSSVTLTLKSEDCGTTEDPPKIIMIPWSKPSNTRKREILGSQSQTNVRPMRTEARRRLLKVIAQGRRWLDELISKEATDIPSLATRYDLSEKTVRSTITLAFLAPEIVQAVIDGKLPRGLGISQLTDLSPDWTEQRRQLGIS
jgi:site-specific DNA recombinase